MHKYYHYLADRCKRLYAEYNNQWGRSYDRITADIRKVEKEMAMIDAGQEPEGLGEWMKEQRRIATQNG